MNANELRIGNYLLFNGSPAPIRGGGILALEQGRVIELGNPQPIPLTPEILEKCWFVKREREDYYLHQNDVHLNFSELRLAFVDGRIHCSIGDNELGILFSIIDFLHQLQNLFFVYAGGELQVNL